MLKFYFLIICFKRLNSVKKKKEKKARIKLPYQLRDVKTNEDKQADVIISHKTHQS